MTPLSHNHHRYVQQRRPRRVAHNLTTTPSSRNTEIPSIRYKQQRHVQAAAQTPSPGETTSNNNDIDIDNSPDDDLIVRSPSGDLEIPNLDILIPENAETERAERDRQEIKKVLEASYSRLHLQENEEAQKLIYSSLREMVNFIGQDEQVLL